MNIPSIVSTLAALGANAPASKTQQQPQPLNSFNEVLSREAAQRSPLRASARPQQASQQPVRLQEAARPQAAKAPVVDEAKLVEAAKNASASAPAPAPIDAPDALASQGADRSGQDKSATEDVMTSLMDIPGAQQAALMMHLMSIATIATSPAPETGTATDLAMDVGTTAGKEGLGQAQLDLRTQIAAVIKSEAETITNAGVEAALSDLHGAFVKADADAASQRLAQQLPSALPVETSVSAPAVTLASLQAALLAVQPPAAPVDKLMPAVGTAAWDQALGQKIVWIAQGGEQSALLTLNPPDLGAMQVVLSVSNNRATVDFMTAQPEVREALENALPRLREMMDESGIQLDQANVSAGGSQQFAGFGDENNGSNGRRGSNSSSGNVGPQIREGIVRVAHDGAVDTFA